MTPTLSFKITPFFDAEYLRNDKRYRHSFSKILMGTYTRPTQQCYFEWHWVILGDLAKYSMSRSVARSQRRAVSLRQLSFLSYPSCRCPRNRGPRQNIVIRTIGVEKKTRRVFLWWWYVWILMICLAFSTQYRRVTDGRTDRRTFATA